MSRKAIAWALYDWANSAYATTVMAGFFPVFIESYWSGGAPSDLSAFRLGVANSVASLIIVLLAPVLGAIADRGGNRKKFLFFFAYLGSSMTAGLFWVAEGYWEVALFFYILGTIGFSGGNVFYDSLIVEVAPPKKVDVISSYGFALGYLGGGLLFVINILMVEYPATFGLAGQPEAVRLSFLTVAAWWALFSLPLFFYVKEPPASGESQGLATIRGGFKQLAQTFRQIRRLRTVFLFLIGYWLYMDGVDTIVRMAVAYGLTLGFEQGHLLKALLLVQFVGFPAALVFGKIGEKLGAKTGIAICIGVYIVITIGAALIQNLVHFYALAVGVGLVQGGIQALSRSLFSRLIPVTHTAEFFGFYNMMGKFAAVIGPTMMGAIGYWTGSPRLSILSILVLFIGGAVFLYYVKVDSNAAPLPSS